MIVIENDGSDGFGLVFGLVDLVVVGFRGG